MTYQRLRPSLHRLTEQGTQAITVQVLEHPILVGYRYAVKTALSVWICESPQDVSYLLALLVKEKLREQDDSQST